MAFMTDVPPEALARMSVTPTAAAIFLPLLYSTANPFPCVVFNGVESVKRASGCGVALIGDFEPLRRCACTRCPSCEAASVKWLAVPRAF